MNRLNGHILRMDGYYRFIDIIDFVKRKWEYVDMMSGCAGIISGCGLCEQNVVRLTYRV